jgi:hypothetical protein
MTIDARNSVRINNSTIRTKSEPQGIVSEKAEGTGPGYDRRLFFCPQYHRLAVNFESELPKPGNLNGPENRGRNCQKGVKTREILRNCLAFKVKFYYNKSLYYVVGRQLMQGVAKLRKVAEVIRTGINYLILPHLAISKGTLLVK